MKASFEIFSLMLLLEREEQKLASTGTRRHTNEEICDFLGMETPAFTLPDMKGTWLTKSTKLALYNTYLTGSCAGPGQKEVKSIQERLDNATKAIVDLSNAVVSLHNRISVLEGVNNKAS